VAFLAIFEKRKYCYSSRGFSANVPDNRHS
jgi:hypothetical protein